MAYGTAVAESHSSVTQYNFKFILSLGGGGVQRKTTVGWREDLVLMEKSLNATQCCRPARHDAASER